VPEYDHISVSRTASWWFRSVTGFADVFCHDAPSDRQADLRLAFRTEGPWTSRLAPGHLRLVG